MKKIIYFFIFLLSIGIAYAIPQIPIQVYGEITPELEDGYEITFEIDGVEYVDGTITSNKYGYDPLIFIPIDDPSTAEKEGYADGDMVDIYIADIKVEEVSLEADTVKIDVQILQSSHNTISSTVPGGSVDRGPSAGGVCEPTWECSDWSSCVNGRQTRICIDKWRCGTTNQKPSEVQPCVVETPPTPPIPIERVPIVEEPRPIVEIEERSYGWAYIIIFIIVLGILGGAGFVFYEKGRAHKAFHQEKKQKTLENQSMMRLKSYVTQTLQQGYAKEQIRQELLKEGWNPGILNKLFSRL